MDTERIKSRHPRLWSWVHESWLLAGRLEDWIDRMALRLGDAILGTRWSEKIFGPHPAHR